MRWSDEWQMYVAAVLLFAAVVLWGAEVPRLAVVMGAAAIALASLAAWRSARTRQVLVVGPRRTEAIDLIDEALDAAGYRVCSCDGPAVRPCPVDARLPCPIHRRIEGAVIVREAADATPVPRCGEALGVPAVVISPTPDGIARLRSSLSV